jgi:hypothetical protein
MSYAERNKRTGKLTGRVLEWKAGLLRDWRVLAHPRPEGDCAKAAAGALGCTGPLAQEVR